MKNYITATRTYATTHKKELTEFAIGVLAVMCVVALLLIVVTLVRGSGPKIVHEPSNACDLFTYDEAKKILGNNALHSSKNGVTIAGDTATSSCGYTDGNPDKETMIVAAITVRSGINDKGVAQNKSEFTAGTPVKNVEIVNELGDKAYFNQALGQLNVLSNHNWIIISNGVGTAPEVNTLADVLKVAREVLPTPTPVTATF